MKLKDSHINAATKVETTSEERKELPTKVKEELKDDDENTGEKVITTMAEFEVKNEPMEDAQDAATSSERPRLPLRIGRPSPYGEWRKVERPIEKPKMYVSSRDICFSSQVAEITAAALQKFGENNLMNN